MVIEKEIDFPPVWLAAFAAAGYAAGRLMPFAPFDGRMAGGVLVALGLLLMGAAALQMAVSRTTVIPRRDPARLVTGGIFRLSRNPIYLADALILTGLYLYWGAFVALPLVGLFMWVIGRRFILGEEERLSRLFGETFATYKKRTRRWI